MLQHNHNGESENTAQEGGVPPPETQPDDLETTGKGFDEPKISETPLPEAREGAAPDGESPEAHADSEAPDDLSGSDEALMQKRKRRQSRKELLEHLQRKNELLMDLDRQVKELKQQLAKKEDRLLRVAAEYENYRKRTRREWELLQKRANADLIREIVGGIDDFDRALDSLGDAEEGLRDGIKLIHAGLMDILRKAGVSEIEAGGTRFDPLYHEAFGEIEKEGMEEGHVAEVIRKGYMLHDEVLRPARVIISKKKA